MILTAIAGASPIAQGSLAYAANQSLAMVANAAQTNGKRLILLELSGANDGLNTLVPYRNDHYYRLRPTIGLKSPTDTITLSDQFAQHAALEPMMPAWQAGELAWLHGLGYPEPNRSHFKSISLWESGGDGNRDGRQGWLTHDIEHNLGRKINDAHGISLKGNLDLFNSDSGTWMSLQTTEQLEASQFALPNYKGGYNTALDQVANQMHELHHAMNGLTSKLSHVPPMRTIRGALGSQLEQLIRLIHAGVDTPVYRIQMTGFDTHEYQLDRHARLLSQVAKGISRLRRELIKAGEWNNTVIMSYSEFGRRASENRSGGTDHGTAAPHFVTGGAVRGGLYGTPPDLSSLNDGDPSFTTDYRALYQQLLSDWFDIPANQFRSYAAPHLSALLRRVS